MRWDNSIEVLLAPHCCFQFFSFQPPKSHSFKTHATRSYRPPPPLHGHLEAPSRFSDFGEDFNTKSLPFSPDHSMLSLCWVQCSKQKASKCLHLPDFFFPYDLVFILLHLCVLMAALLTLLPPVSTFLFKSQFQAFCLLYIQLTPSKIWSPETLCTYYEF